MCARVRVFNLCARDRNGEKKILYIWCEKKKKNEKEKKIEKYITGTPRCRASRLDPNTRFREFIIPLCQKSSKAALNTLQVTYGAAAGSFLVRARVFDSSSSSCVYNNIQWEDSFSLFLSIYYYFYSDSPREFDRNIRLFFFPYRRGARARIHTTTRFRTI